MIFDHEARRHRIGASEVAAILGMSEYTTPLDFWLEKTGRKPRFEGNEHTRRGQRQEAQILDWLGESLGKLIVTDCETVIHENGIAAATPDGYVYGESDVVELAETKSTLKWINSEADIPDTWILQCQWQMICTGLKKCHLAVFGPMVSDYQRFEIVYNEAFATELMNQALEWWNEYIVGDKMPPPLRESDVMTLYPKDDGTSIEAVPALYQAIAEHSTIKAKIKDLEAGIQSLRDRITMAIGEAKTVRYGGRTIASYKTNAAGSRVFRTF